MGFVLLSVLSNLWDLLIDSEPRRRQQGIELMRSLDGLHRARLCGMLFGGSPEAYERLRFGDGVELEAWQRWLQTIPRPAARSNAGGVRLGLFRGRAPSQREWMRFHRDGLVTSGRFNEDAVNEIDEMLDVRRPLFFADGRQGVGMWWLSGQWLRMYQTASVGAVLMQGGVTARGHLELDRLSLRSGYREVVAFAPVVMAKGR
ncbi:MAG: hypothetical protein AAFV53_41410 [Myxococcota bacterium]